MKRRRQPFVYWRLHTSKLLNLAHLSVRLSPRFTGLLNSAHLRFAVQLRKLPFVEFFESPNELRWAGGAMVRQSKSPLLFIVRGLFTTTADGTRTRTDVTVREILSLLRLPFTAWLRVIFNHIAGALASIKGGGWGLMAQKSCQSVQCQVIFFSMSG